MPLLGGDIEIGEWGMIDLLMASVPVPTYEHGMSFSSAFVNAILLRLKKALARESTKDP